MLQQTITIPNKLGLHARAAAKLVAVAAGYGCSVRIGRPQHLINGKSIMAVMTLGAAQHSDIVIETDGEDQQQAMDALCALINDKFGEGE